MWEQVFACTKPFRCSGGLVVILELPEIVYPTSNWGVYLCSSHEWSNRDWGSQYTNSTRL